MAKQCQSPAVQAQPHHGSRSTWAAALLRLAGAVRSTRLGRGHLPRLRRHSRGTGPLAQNCSGLVYSNVQQTEGAVSRLVVPQPIWLDWVRVRQRWRLYLGYCTACTQKSRGQVYESTANIFPRAVRGPPGGSDEPSGLCVSALCVS